MSQVKFDTTFNNKSATLVSGWDPPLGFYHLTIYSKNVEDEEILYDGLDRLGFNRHLGNLKKEISNLGITPPPDFYQLCAEKEGNVTYTWNGQAWVKSRF